MIKKNLYCCRYSPQQPVSGRVKALSTECNYQLKISRGGHELRKNFNANSIIDNTVPLQRNTAIETLTCNFDVTAYCFSHTVYT